LLADLGDEHQFAGRDPTVDAENGAFEVVGVGTLVVNAGEGEVNARGVDAARELAGSKAGFGDEGIVTVYKVGFAGFAQAGAFDDDAVEAFNVEVDGEDTDGLATDRGKQGWRWSWWACR
jgi:hypothetical protein